MDFSPTNLEGEPTRVREMRHYWLRDYRLITPDLVERNGYGELGRVFFPFRHQPLPPYHRIYPLRARPHITVDSERSYIYGDMGWSMEAWRDARTPALGVVARGDRIQPVSPAGYQVRSQSRPGVTYSVRVFREPWSCTCDSFESSKIACVHILAVRLRRGFKESVAPMHPEADLCRRCQSGDVILYGEAADQSWCDPSVPL